MYSHIGEPMTMKGELEDLTLGYMWLCLQNFSLGIGHINLCVIFIF